MDSTVRRFVWGGFLVAIGVALLLSPFASKSPDGLDRVAEDKGFLEKGAADPVCPAPARDYEAPWIATDWLSTSVAGVAGTCLTFGLAYGLALLIARRGNRSINS
jgi:cobalt/nickel transport protein